MNCQQDAENAFSTIIQEECEMNTLFVGKLREQSTKIQKMLQMMDSLKQQNSRKSTEIRQLKSKNNQLIRQIQQKQYELGKQEQNQFNINQLQKKIERLTQERNELQQQFEILKLNKNRKTGINWEVEKANYEQKIKDSLKQRTKLKQMYTNCKQQNNILRQELQQLQKQYNELNKFLTKQKNKSKYQLQTQQNQIIHLTQAIAQQKQKNIILSQELNCLEKTIAEKQVFFRGQLITYEEQIKQMIRLISEGEKRQASWKHKYTQLQAFVFKIQSLRREWRMNKEELRNTQPDEFTQIL